MTDQHPDLLTITEAAAIVRRPVATLRYSAPPRHRTPQLPTRLGESSTRRPPCRSGSTANRATRSDAGAKPAYRYM